MRNQFFYTRTVRTEVPATETTEAFVDEKRLLDSFNLGMVIRTVTLENGSVVVLLNDMHEQTSKEPIINTHTNKVKGYKDVRSTVQSEIVLSIEDGRRFFEVANIENEHRIYIPSSNASTSADDERRQILERANSID